jgi:hypothetical protein
MSWDVENGSDTIIVTIKTGCDQVETVVYSPDTTMIATGGVERPARLLDP